LLISVPTGRESVRAQTTIKLRLPQRAGYGIDMNGKKQLLLSL